MPSGNLWIGLALAATLMLPPPGTDSRDRAFCDAWLSLLTAERHDVLLDAEAREGGPPPYRECRARLRAPLRHKLDNECKNWRLLMDFEVRIYVDGVLEPCAPDA
ncbi:MAG: hypothetical protein HKP30_05045 [Myxococcales bacterium]|nr:hypothetical protein [Myxococcales bacterium]